MSSKTSVFFENGTNVQFEFVLSKYQDALNAKAHAKSSKPEALLKLDKWYQTELPKKIKSRGKEAFLTHDEIVQTIKWKLARGQFRPRLKDLVQMNTPRVVMQETKKAFRALYKKNDLEAAVLALSNLKGVGPAMASAVLAAGAPEVAPFMADECLMAMENIEGIDYTMKEYLKLVEKTKECVERLNSQGGTWNPHTVELAVWTHYVARDIMPELLDDMPDASSSPSKTKGLNGSNGQVNGNTTDNGSVHVNGSSEDSNEVADTLNGGNEDSNGATEGSNGVNEDSVRLEATESSSSKEDENSEDGAVNEPNGSANGVETEPGATEPVEATEQNGGEERADEQSSKENGVSSPEDSTKEETSTSASDTLKRGLEDEDSSETYDPKRMKEDVVEPPAADTAGGD